MLTRCADRFRGRVLLVLAVVDYAVISSGCVVFAGGDDLERGRQLEFWRLAIRAMGAGAVLMGVLSLVGMAGGLSYLAKTGGRVGRGGQQRSVPVVLCQSAVISCTVLAAVMLWWTVVEISRQLDRVW